MKWRWLDGFISLGAKSHVGWNIYTDNGENKWDWLTGSARFA